MVMIISRSLYNDIEFSKVKEVGITKHIWCNEQIVARFDLVQGPHQVISQQKTEMHTSRRRPSNAALQGRSSDCTALTKYYFIPFSIVNVIYCTIHILCKVIRILSKLVFFLCRRGAAYAGCSETIASFNPVLVFWRFV